MLALLCLLSSVVWLIGSVSILLTEQYPARLWRFQYAVIGWQAHLLAYLASLVEPYPPYSLGSRTTTPQTA